MKPKNESRIIVCPKCNGSGYVDSRTSLYESERVDCGYCGGKRVIIETEVITHEQIKE